MRVILLLLLSFPLFTHAAPKPDAIVRAEIQAQLIALDREITELIANGLDNNHPKVLQLTKQADLLKEQVTQHTPPPEETIILLEGTQGTSLTSGERVNMQEMLKQGWHIRSLTAAGENKAYLWLQR